ncbi:hypothetical protein HPB47_010145 [Ixodes persulcatus]|uniref:Uncharacterized protein n=1 Tax=Ixodes persulcatus TaxID=34615 RepID=A0AC60P080_IXOPE|nr:hypothetical protein HPB47_010145 [Ixodes persulcatus]
MTSDTAVRSEELGIGEDAALLARSGYVLGDELGSGSHSRVAMLNLFVFLFHCDNQVIPGLVACSAFAGNERRGRTSRKRDAGRSTFFQDYFHSTRKVSDFGTGLAYACKVVYTRRTSRNFRVKFLPRQLGILSRLRHSHIVRVLEILHRPSRVFIVMELVLGGNLFTLVSAEGRLSESRAHELFVQLACAVAYLHRHNIAHRDIKCENVLLSHDGIVKLADFGFSRYCDDPEHKGRQLMSQTYCGSEAYAAPEVLKGVRYLPKSADMWSLGAVLFVLVTGALPFDVGSLARQVRQQMTRTVRFPRQLVATPELRNVIRTLLEPVVHLRGTMGQLVRHRWMRMYPDPLKRLAERSLKQSREGFPVVSAMLQRPFSNIAEDGTVLASLTHQAALEDLFASDKSNLTTQVESFDWSHADLQEAQHGSLYSQDVASDVWDRAEAGWSFAYTGAHGKRSEPQSPKDFFASLKPDEGAREYADDAKAGRAFREFRDPSQRLTDFASKLHHTDDHQSYDHDDFVVHPAFDDDDLEAQFEALMATFKNKSTRSGTSSEPSEKSFEAGSDLLGHRSMSRTSPNN